MKRTYILMTALLLTMVISSAAISADKMYWTDYGTDKIQRADLNGDNVEDLVEGLDAPYGIALDLNGGKMYWADGGTSKIQRADLNGDNVEDLVEGLGDPAGIALDLSSDKMYWIDYGTDKIQRADLNGDNVEDLVEGLDSPYDIALDLNGGKMYWTDNSTNKIQRADFNGDNVEDLVTGLNGLDGIALDLSSDKMYWTDSDTDKIQRADLNGDNVEDLVTEAGLDAAYGIALDLSGGKMYWTDTGTDKIQRADLDGANVEDLVISGLEYPYYIAIARIAGYNSTPTAPGGTIDFGSSPVGVAVNETFDVQETKNANLTVDKAATAITGAHAADFSIVSPVFPFTITDGGADKTVTVACTPSAEGVRTAILNLTSNDWKNAAVTYTLTCTTEPSVGNVALILPSGPVGIGTVIGISVQFGELVTVQGGGVPSLALNTGGSAPVYAHYISGTGTNTLTFEYTLVAGDDIAKLEYWNSSALALNGAQIVNSSGKDMDLALPTPGESGSLGHNITSGGILDILFGPPPVPTVTGAGVTFTTVSGVYSAGSAITITVPFSYLVWVKGIPSLALNTGGPVPGYAYYKGGSGTKMITFEYTVAAGDDITKLDYWSPWALELNGGQMYSNEGVDINLILPVPGEEGSLGYNNTQGVLNTVYSVYRFYSPGLLKHLFTADENEKEYILANMADVWEIEDSPYSVFLPWQYNAATQELKNTLMAVHRFYNAALQTHLYTVDANEAASLTAESAETGWGAEGPVFYVPVGNPEGAIPVYRFYNKNLKVHLFTADENEKNTLKETAGDVWRYEGVAYYAYP
ncbi:choice-of-anchor D domain-containing protein [Desulfococcaceae bacterium HSG7]|nr:choice-of-anchor D domain-containing protein [Desulfococcaceae bacterium HSG7]